MSPTTAAEQPLPARKSLRAKAWFATLALLAYVLGSVLYISTERTQVFDNIQALDRLAKHEKALALAEASIKGALIDATEVSSSSATDSLASHAELLLYMETCARLLSALESFDPGYALIQRAVARSFSTLQDHPARLDWIELRDSLSRAAADLEIRHHSLADQRDMLTLGYQRQYDAVTVESLVLATAGLASFGSLAFWFFTRLAGDVRRLEAHARNIVRGARGVSLEVSREDELGRLMHAVNRMAVDLDEREKQIEVDGQRRSHQDKMLAVGALAAGVAHEVNNPLAVIAGIAQELRSADLPLTQAQLAERAELILTQAQRAAQVARHLAEAATPQPAELDWVDLNAMVRRVVRLMGYDRRYRSFGFEIDGDAALPAVRTSGDAVQQVLMQMLTLGCDAMAGRALSPAWVKISTVRRGPDAEVGLLFPPVLDFARSEVQRSLLLSRAIVEPLGARLAFGQVDGPYLRITLTLSALDGDEQG